MFVKYERNETLQDGNIPLWMFFGSSSSHHNSRHSNGLFLTPAHLQNGPAHDVCCYMVLSEKVDLNNTSNGVKFLSSRYSIQAGNQWLPQKSLDWTAHFTQLQLFLLEDICSRAAVWFWSPESFRALTFP